MRVRALRKNAEYILLSYCTGTRRTVKLLRGEIDTSTGVARIYGTTRLLVIRRDAGMERQGYLTARKTSESSDFQEEWT